MLWMTIEKSRTLTGPTFFVFMTNLLSPADFQNIFIILFSFVIGIVAKAHIPFGKNTNDTMTLLQKDYEVMKKLYDAKVDELEKKNDIITMQKETIAEARARVTSYENFLQARTFETDRLLKRLPPVINAIAHSLNVPIPREELSGHETAHSQMKSNA